jgi:tetratricopeptide (TPR) repeat protein
VNVTFKNLVVHASRFSVLRSCSCSVQGLGSPVRVPGSAANLNTNRDARIEKRKRQRSRLLAVALGCSLALNPPAAQETSKRGLTGVPALARTYNAILDGQFDRVPKLLDETCGPAPREACLLLDAASVWWRIQLDPWDTSHDAAFQSKVETAIAAATEWTVREPMRAEAWFYLGAAYGARVQWWSLRGERLAAAREGKRIKNALERALALDPDMADAYFGLGLYHYYADVAPGVLKMLRWLLLLPGGDRVLGMEEILRARSAGQLIRSEAEYQLYVIYVWYEKQPASAIELLGKLRARYPHNPHFAQAIAEIQDFYIDDTPASLRTWQELLDAAQRGQVAKSEVARVSARLGIASQLDQLSQGEAALEHLHAVISAQPSAPFAAVARAKLQLGETLQHLGRRDEAAAAYRAAIDAAGRNDPIRIAPRARAALRAIERSPRSR